MRNLLSPLTIYVTSGTADRDRFTPKTMSNIHQRDHSKVSKLHAVILTNGRAHGNFDKLPTWCEKHIQSTRTFKRRLAMQTHTYPKSRVRFTLPYVAYARPCSNIGTPRHNRHQHSKSLKFLKQHKITRHGASTLLTGMDVKAPTGVGFHIS